MQTDLPFSHIIVALDGSTTAERALQPAIQFAKSFQATLVLLRAAEEESLPPPQQQQVNVVSGPAAVREFGNLATFPVPESVGYGQATQTIEDSEARGYIHILGEELRNQGINVTEDVYPGDLAEAIIDQASQYTSPLIVMSSRNHSGIEKLLFGSVTDSVLQRAPCPVMIIRED